MPHDLSFGDTHIYSPLENRILIPVWAYPPNDPAFEIRALLDTGAEISNFDHSLLPLLGITDVTKGFPMEVASASQVGTSDTGYIHDVDIVVFGRPVTIPVVFCPTWPEGTPNLLGMEGFFDHWVFAIDHSRRRLYYEPAT